MALPINLEENIYASKHNPSSNVGADRCVATRLCQIFKQMLKETEFHEMAT